MSQTIKELYRFEKVKYSRVCICAYDWNQGVFMNYLQVAEQGQQLAVEGQAEGWPQAAEVPLNKKPVVSLCLN